MSQATFEQLVALLEKNQACYRVIEHQNVGKTTLEVAKERGTEHGQGAKSLVCVVKGKGIKQYVLAVLPADKQADLKKLAQTLGGQRASLTSPLEVENLTDCVFGAVPPFSFHEELLLVNDPSLFERYTEIAFNAGLRERSIILNTQDYARITQAKQVEFAL